MTKTVKFDKRDVPVDDVLKIRTVFVSDTIMTEFTYRVFNPHYAEIVTLLPHSKGYEIEKKVRRHAHRL